jgi:uncharacterized membrane protein HdeD (DUF308 family)
MDENNTNKPKKPLAKKVMQFSGIAFVAIGALALLGWMQSRDPDCYLAETDEDSLNFLRMCEMEIALAQTNVWWPLVVSIVAIILGLALIRWSNKKLP